MLHQLTNLSEAVPQGVDWIKLAQNGSWWWAFVYTVVKLLFYKSRLKFLTRFSSIDFYKGQFFKRDNQRPVLGVRWVRVMSHFSSTHLPVCVNYLHLAACESGTGHSGSKLSVRNSNWNVVEHVRVAKSWCIYVVRI